MSANPAPYPVFHAAPVSPFDQVIAAGQTVEHIGLGYAFYVKEAEYDIMIGIDDGPLFAWDLAMKLDFSKIGFQFKKVRIKNLSDQPSRVQAFSGFFDIGDSRLNIIESRNGSASAQIPANLISASLVLATGAAEMFLDLDYSRAEVWLYPDVFGTVFWGEDNAIGTEDFRRVGLSLDGFTKLKCKAPIWVRGTAGATVRAFIYSY